MSSSGLLSNGCFSLRLAREEPQRGQPQGTTASWNKFWLEHYEPWDILFSISSIPGVFWRGNNQKENNPVTQVLLGTHGPKAGNGASVSTTVPCHSVGKFPTMLKCKLMPCVSFSYWCCCCVEVDSARTIDL